MARADATQRHGGNLAAAARQLGRRPGSLLDASASLVPFGPPWQARWAGLFDLQASRIYPDRRYAALRAAMAGHHGVDPEAVRATCTRELARYKRPRQFLVVEERDLPLTITGKVKKDELVRRFLPSGSN